MLAMGLALAAMGCHIRPAVRIGVGALLVAAYFPLASKADSQKNFRGEATGDSLLTGLLAITLLYGGIPLTASGVYSLLEESAEHDAQARLAAESKLAGLITRAARDERCESALIMLAHLRQQNGVMAQILLDTEESVARCGRLHGAER